MYFWSSDDGQGSPTRRGTNRVQCKCTKKVLYKEVLLSKIELASGETHPMPMVTLRI